MTQMFYAASSEVIALALLALLALMALMALMAACVEIGHWVG